VAEQLGPELTAFFMLRQAYIHTAVAYADAEVRLIYTKTYCYTDGSDLAGLHKYVSQEEESLWRKYPRDMTQMG